jgi:hypothetical protein
MMAKDIAESKKHPPGTMVTGWLPAFDRQGRFVHMPSLDLPRLAQCFRASMVAFFLTRSLINERLAKRMLGWTHSGFSLDYANWNPSTPRRTIQA